MLDPGSPQIAPVDVPGVAHLPLRATLKPFRLLHAKVAVLGFRHEKQRSNWMARLIVSTGNWTRQTLEESLDLCWVVDINGQDVTHFDKAQVCADLRAAFDLVNYVRETYDLRMLGATVAQLDEWLGKLPSAADLPAPRFFDNRTQSFMEQVPGLVKMHAGSAARNHLSMGAGFYEAPSGQRVPAVLERISTDLRRAGLLTANPEVAVFVNETACQAVASGAESIRKRGGKSGAQGNRLSFPKTSRVRYTPNSYSAPTTATHRITAAARGSTSAQVISLAPALPPPCRPVAATLRRASCSRRKVCSGTRMTWTIPARS